MCLFGNVLSQSTSFNIKTKAEKLVFEKYQGLLFVNLVENVEDNV